MPPQSPARPRMNPKLRQGPRCFRLTGLALPHLPQGFLSWMGASGPPTQPGWTADAPLCALTGDREHRFLWPLEGHMSCSASSRLVDECSVEKSLGRCGRVYTSGTGKSSPAGRPPAQVRWLRSVAGSLSRSQRPPAPLPEPRPHPDRTLGLLSWDKDFTIQTFGGFAAWGPRPDQVA